MSLARRFINKFGEGLEQRVKNSADLTAGLMSFLADTNTAAADKEECCAVVVSDERLMPTDRKRLRGTIHETKASAQEFDGMWADGQPSFLTPRRHT